MKKEHKYWKLLRRGELIPLKLFKGHFDYYLNKRTGKEEKMIVVRSRDAGNVVAITKEGKAVMVRQFRFGIEADTIEIPGGLIEKGEDPMEAVKRELLEETGYSGGEWQFLQTIESNPVYMDGLIHQYVAVGVEKTGAQHLDPGENIEVEEMSEADLKDAFESGIMRHPHTLTGLMRVFDFFGKVKI